MPVNEINGVKIRFSNTCSKYSLQKRKYMVQLWQRQSGRCAICGDEVDLTLRQKDSMAPSLDHVMPKSLGGPNSFSNYRLTHRICNNRRGNKLILS